ncbi:hypothetical protein U0E23_20755, partial [Burkholderia stagnalis]|uniref:hypothetical protein n=1 Tax=Burkholderia stagnalis TaxID=1503054 RepID=UPI002AB3C733
TWICIHCSFWSIASLCAQKADCTERWLRFTSREVAHYYFAPNMAIAFEHYNERHPHKALKYRSPREFRRAALSST